MPQPGDWVWSGEHRQAGRVVEAHELWGDAHCQVWLPAAEALVRVRAERLEPAARAGVPGRAWLAYVAAAGRVAGALTQDTLLAPIESSVIPLPHQIQALMRATDGSRVRFLLADEVGLGKTVEAGLIMRELKLRGVVRRTLVVAPKGLVNQWVGDAHSLRGGVPRVHPERLPRVPSSRLRRQRVADVRPGRLPAGRGQAARRTPGVWSRERVAEHNRERFEDLTAAGWDLIIIDDAHRLGGSTDQVARHQLGRGLADAAPCLLLLSATPHQGKTDAFHRLMSLIDETAFADPSEISGERVQPFVIRTEKRHAIDSEGQPLFKPRHTRLEPIAYQERHAGQRTLYEAVTEYARVGYNRAIREHKGHVGFLMILMQRLVTSSTRAIRVTLERRLDVLTAPGEQLMLFPELTDEEWVELDGQEQIDTLLISRLSALKNERAEVELLLETAKRTETAGADAKADALLDWIYRLQQDEGDPDLKILIFTEFVSTQEMLREFLADRGFSVVCLNGSMGLDERANVQRSFAGSTRFLVSTDAGGEGLNLQFCHVVINYDIPWNPMKLEQRIGRVDRIGQEHAVRAVNFVVADTVEHRVREVLEEKLAIILEEFGVDKTADILDSAEAGQMFDALYVDAFARPENLHAQVDSVVREVAEHGQAARNSDSVLGRTEELDPGQAVRLKNHPLPHWIEAMTVNHVRAQGGTAERHGRAWRLTWPDGARQGAVVFSAADAQRDPSARHLTLEDPRVRELAERLPRIASGQPIPCLAITGLPAGVRGSWSLWQVTLHAPEQDRSRVMPLFRHDDGRVLAPTARFIWDRLLSEQPVAEGNLDGAGAATAFGLVEQSAHEHGQPIYQDLLQAHRSDVSARRDRSEHSFAARRRSIARIGLPAVRNHRLAQLATEERSWRTALDREEDASPDLVPVVIVRVDGGER